MISLMTKCLKNCRVKFQQTVPNRCLHPKVLFLRPDPTEVPKITNVDVVDFFGYRAEFQSDFESIVQERMKMLELMPKAQDELPPRTMKDSLVTAIIPLSSNRELRDRYLAASGQLRAGRLLEDTDIFAVYAAYNQLKNPKSEAAGAKVPHVVVTGCIDTIQLTPDLIKSTEDIRMSAHVSYVGKTSLEVCLSVDQKRGNAFSETIFEAIFVLVAKDAIGLGPGIVNPLIAETTEEKAYIDQAKERQSRRKFDAQESLTRRPPNELERQLIHNKFLERTKQGFTRGLSTNQKLMGDTKSSTIFICHPMFRNHFRKVFGGFIMRQAFELAYMNSFIYARQRPYVIAIDDIVFLQPVEIGSFLRFRSCIGFVKNNIIHTPVFAEIIDPASGEVSVSNEFNFTFRTNDPSISVPDLTFDTYAEAMTYVKTSL
ncbi:acyl-coenzyme A thioesterase 9, mitochondrial [Folsomia candida]|uniref:acyl-coenzyme A thioesterase 9, mitochondrial n=1 Tax=Folsomia candida TaxID=158441 RepID=UPI000B8EFC16|nr:acyl-coenzyme A thioesterase 9, mitochondrial [Folsomia candida]